MYKMPYFTESNQQLVLDFMHHHTFITLIATSNGKSYATQIPVLLYEKEDGLYLQGHIMRKTDHHLAIENNPEVLILFQGPHCYVSSSWYIEKMGATWNYQTVHVRGMVRIMSDEEIIDLLTNLTEKYERVQPAPLYANELPENYMPTHVKAIAGLEVKVTDLYPIFKLSQNRDDTSYRNIVTHLMQNTDTEAHKIANEMIERRAWLFK